MKWLTRSIIPTMVALAALIAFLPRSGPTIRIGALDFRYSPATLVVHEGDSVLVENRGDAAHTFTCPGCDVDTRNVPPGEAKVVRFHKAGTFTFVCRYHRTRGMGGRVVVLREGERAPTGSPSPSPSPDGSPPAADISPVPPEPSPQ